MKKRRLNDEIGLRVNKDVERDFEDMAWKNQRLGFVVDVSAQPSEASVSVSGRPSAMTNRLMEPVSGASVLKYELVEKQSKKVLLAKRCSLRNRKPEFVQQVPAALECSFDYKPSEFENLFKPQQEDLFNQQMQEIAFQHSTKVGRKDVEQVLGKLTDDLALV